MSIRIPQNQIVKSKYTIGKQYMYENNQVEYQGYYYELNGKIFAGKEFNSNAPILVRIILKNINTLLTSASTYIYGKISGTKLLNTNISSYNSQKDSEQSDTILQYFISRKNNTPILIKQVDKDTFIKCQNDPLYSVVSIFFYPGSDRGYISDDINKAEIIIPGIKTYLEG